MNFADDVLSPVPALEHVGLYRPPAVGSHVDLRLDGNEGAAPPPEMLAALAAQGAEVLRRYPDASDLEALIAERHGVDPAQVVVTAGADEALDRACRALIGPGREAVLPLPTFEMLEKYVQLAGAFVRGVPWMEGPYPTDAVLAALGPETSMIAVVSPNNPTGAVARPQDVERLAREAPHAAVFVDLAYEEFADTDLAPVALRHPNAIVFKTVSKAWGLAGLRIGYAVATQRIAAWIRSCGSPYPNAGLSLWLASRALRDGNADMQRFVARVREERETLVEALSELGATPFPSQANFVLARFADADWVWEGLAGLGIAVRLFPGRERLDGCIRITCPGHEEEFARLLRGLRAAMAPRALLFDLDGVLADVTASYRASIVQTAASYGIAVSLHDITILKAAGGANNDWEVTKRLLAQRGVDLPLHQVTERFESFYQGTADRPGLRAREHLLPERALLKRLAERLPLGVVTGRPRQDAHRFLKEADVADLFGAVVCLEDGPLKPDAAPVRRALDMLGVERAWMVGDTPDDVRAARAAGVVPLGIAPPGEDAADTLIGAGAARVLTDLSELEELLP